MNKLTAIPRLYHSIRLPNRGFQKLGAAVAISILLVGLSAGGNAQTAAPSPKQIVEEYHAVLLSLMKDAESLKIKGRYNRLEPVFVKNFNLPFMMKIVAGSKWRKASTEHKKLLVNAFKRMSVWTYASRFDDFSGERFETIGQRDGPRKTTIVDTLIHRPNKSAVKLSYLLRKFDGKWRIIDIILAGGISELALRHSEYRSILKSKGADGLANILNKKADQLIGK